MPELSQQEKDKWYMVVEYIRRHEGMGSLGGGGHDRY